VLRYAIHRSARGPSGQAVASYARLVKCRKESGGKRLGPAGNTIGNAPRTGAFSEAAGLCLRNNEPGQKYRARGEKTPDPGKALSLLAQTLGRAVYALLKRQRAWDMAVFLRPYGSRVGEPGAALDTPGMRRTRAASPGSLTASVTAAGPPKPCLPAPDAGSGPPLWLSNTWGWSHKACVCGPSPAPGTNWRGKNTQPPRCRGRDEGTA
jgi:hypothetical protein